MDKYEFNIKVEQIKKMVNSGDYDTAMKIADTIDWRRVRNVNILSMVATIYEKNEEYQESKDILLLAFERAPIGKRLLFKLAELAIKEGSLREAEDYYREFCDLTPDDPRQYILRYMILSAKGAPAEQLIHTLEQYCSIELDEKWLYGLAELYAQAGMGELCVMACDKIMLMFGLGKYVEKAMELKIQFAPLTSYQMDLVENRDKYEAKLRAVEDQYRAGGPVQNYEDDLTESPLRRNRFGSRPTIYDREAAATRVPGALDEPDYGMDDGHAQGYGEEDSYGMENDYGRSNVFEENYGGEAGYDRGYGEESDYNRLCVEEGSYGRKTGFDRGGDQDGIYGKESAYDHNRGEEGIYGLESDYGRSRGVEGSNGEESSYGRSHGKEGSYDLENGYDLDRGLEGSYGEESVYGGSRGGEESHGAESSYSLSRGVEESDGEEPIYGGSRGIEGSEGEESIYGGSRGGEGSHGEESIYGGSRGVEGSYGEESVYGGSRGEEGSAGEESVYGGSRGEEGSDGLESAYGRNRGVEESAGEESVYGGNRGGNEIYGLESAYGHSRGVEESDGKETNYGRDLAGEGNHIKETANDHLRGEEKDHAEYFSHVQGKNTRELYTSSTDDELLKERPPHTQVTIEPEEAGSTVQYKTEADPSLAGNPSEESKEGNPGGSWMNGEISGNMTDEALKARMHEAQVQANLAKEMCKISGGGFEQEAPSAQTRVLTDIRDIIKEAPHKARHLMIEAETPQEGIEHAVKILKEIHKETATKNQAAKITGKRLNSKGVFNLSDKLTGKDLMIEQAGDMTDGILQELNQLMARDETGMNVVLIDTAERLAAIYKIYPGLAKRFEYHGKAVPPKGNDYEAPKEDLRPIRKVQVQREEIPRETKEEPKSSETVSRQPANRSYSAAGEPKSSETVSRQPANRPYPAAGEPKPAEAVSHQPDNRSYPAAGEPKSSETVSRQPANRPYPAAGEPKPAETVPHQPANRPYPAAGEPNPADQSEAETASVKEKKKPTPESGKNKAKKAATTQSAQEQAKRAPSKEMPKEEIPKAEIPKMEIPKMEIPQMEIPDDEEMDIDEFAKYASEYATSIDCSISGKSMLALYERIEIMEEDGIALTKENGEDLIEEAADRAENPSFFRRITGIFSSRYDKNGLLILKEEHFI